jgi:hypothetical protein
MINPLWCGAGGVPTPDSQAVSAVAALSQQLTGQRLRVIAHGAGCVELGRQGDGP